MLEKDIENLIAKYPDEFFPKENFKLISQQYNIEGKRIDILFEDKFKRKIIIEVKRGILSREASGQIAEYFGLLKSKDDKSFYEMILCANIIPKERKLFLEHIGIDCKELGISFISEIAKKYNYQFSDEIEAKVEIDKNKEKIFKSENKEVDDEVSVWIFQGNPEKYDILNALSDKEVGNNIHWLVNQNKKKIKKGHIGIIWMSGPDAGIYAITRINNDPELMIENKEETKYWVESKNENKESLRVGMSIITRLINKPILKKQIRNIQGLGNLSILRQFQGTNFPVTNSEWKILSELIEK